MKSIVSFINSLLDYLKGLISSASEASHKRYIAIGSFYILCLFGLINQIFGLRIEPMFLYIFGGLAIGQSTLTMFEKR